MKKGKYTDFESSILESILRGDHEVLHKLREQKVASEIVGRENTGFGFFVYIKVPMHLRLEPPISFVLGKGIHINIIDFNDEVGTALFVKDGLISSLECYTYTEQWPGNIIDYTITDDIPIEEKKENLDKLYD